MATKAKTQNRNTGLKILIQERDGLHCLMVQSLAGLNPVGWRLQKAGRFPVQEFEFLDLGDAMIAQKSLQEYLNT